MFVLYFKITYCIDTKQWYKVATIWDLHTWFICVHFSMTEQQCVNTHLTDTSSWEDIHLWSAGQEYIIIKTAEIFFKYFIFIKQNNRLLRSISFSSWDQVGITIPTVLTKIYNG